MNIKLCPICNAIIKGRSDKIFCSVKCKSIDQYEQRLESEQFYLKVERQLRTNRKLLKRYNKSGFTTIRKSELISEGFNPNFFTHYWKSSKGEIYLFVYEYGFLSITKGNIDKYLLVIWQEYMDRGNGI